MNQQSIFSTTSENNNEKGKVADFRKYYSLNKPRFEKAKAAMENLLNLLAQDVLEHPPKVTGRIKDQTECLKKYERKYQDNQEDDSSINEVITDIIGIRIICIYETDIEKVAGVIRDHLDVIGETDKTSALESQENKFGYKGLHMDVGLDTERSKLPEYKNFAGLRFEIQVRSIVQDAWSEVDHKLKYKKTGIPPNLKRRINRLSALFEIADQEFETIRNETIKLEEKGRESLNTASGAAETDAPVSPFNFRPFVETIFEDAEFPYFKVDNFVEELLRQNTQITFVELKRAIEDNLPRVEEYADYMSNLDHSLNPFTRIRHCIYMSDNNTYCGLMKPGQKTNFDRWLEHGTVHPKEIGAKSN